MTPSELPVVRAARQQPSDEAIAELGAASAELDATLAAFAATAEQALRDLAQQAGTIAAMAEHMAHEAHVQQEHPHAVRTTYRVLDTESSAERV